MRLLRGLPQPQQQPSASGVVATIGNFDGVHLGHQALIARCVSQASALGLQSMVVVFEPHPQEYFALKQEREVLPARLDTWRDKYEKVAQLGVDFLLCLPFNANLAELSAEAFISDVLVARLKVKHLVLGDDFRFGQGRKGDFHLLQEKAETGGYSLESIDSFLQAEQRISSTAIRAALAEGDCEKAADLLGRDYSISGRVSHGEERGRTLGFPTANIALKRRQSAVSGVFAVRSEWQGQLIDGVANIGPRPTVNGLKPRLEVHFFDLNQDLYGQRLRIRLLGKIREEKRFGSLAELQEQITIDSAEAKKFLSQIPRV